MTRKLGASGLQVPPLCLGGNVFGWTADEPASFAILDALVEAGFNFIDTADVYSRWVPGHQGGESETTIGKWLKRTGNRGKVVIATKAGHFEQAMLLKLILGGLAGAFAGANLSALLPPRPLRIILSVWLVSMGGQLCWKALV